MVIYASHRRPQTLAVACSSLTTDHWVQGSPSSLTWLIRYWPRSGFGLFGSH